MYLKIEGNALLLRIDVPPSYHTTNEPNKLYVAVKFNGNVLAGHCNCMAG